ncbi:hypothetical protein [Bifidobacterium samirii]|uniref:hypothetical protein n=1 Tax=Bifidobacterium samirii TaxID=2306974 RepID=UPI000F7F15E2|nr:hypothetical protein [Bifidobacterium samirii]
MITNPSFESDESWELWDNNAFYVESNLTLLPHSGNRFLNSQIQNTWVAIQRVAITEPGTYELSAYFASGAIDRWHMLGVVSPDSVWLASKTWERASAVMTWERRALTVDIPKPMTVQIQLGGNWPRIDDVALVRVK